MGLCRLEKYYRREFLEFLRIQSRSEVRHISNITDRKHSEDDNYFFFSNFPVSKSREKIHSKNEVRIVIRGLGKKLQRLFNLSV